MIPAARPPIDLLGEMLAALLRRREMPRIGDPAQFLEGNTAKRYPAAFLIGLCGDTHPRFEVAQKVLAEVGSVPAFFRSTTSAIRDELSTAVARYPGLRGELAAAADITEAAGGEEAQDRVWAVTFPEGVGLDRHWASVGSELQARRGVTIRELNQEPIVDPISSMLLTANVLVAPQAGRADPDYWYDHPIPLNAEAETTEIAHGLRRLDGAVGYELDRHPEWCGPLSVVLSVSTTHRGLEGAARDMVERVVAAIGPLPNLRVFAFDESLTRQLWERVVAPTFEHEEPASALDPVFGVAGAYGRHYSFLKAIAALWSVCVDHSIVATFKVDLDQSFPQDRLVEETGQSGFEHFTTSRWGAVATSADGSHLDLAMIAGGLVNEADIDMSLFTPDVTRAAPTSAEDSIFFSRLPQALSTAFEIGAAYDSVDRDRAAMERIHVTGGTNGILVDRLRRWRLFTPSVTGRAEDQAYLLSGLGEASERPAYLHEPGLIMRHDKADLIPELIKAGAASKHIGDLLRMRLFSAYASAPDKALLDPFTGCFVSRIPVTVTALRLALHALGVDPSQDADGYLREGVARLEDVAHTVARLDETVRRERGEWDRFYDGLDRIEQGRASGDELVAQLVARAKAVVSEAEIAQ